MKMETYPARWKESMMMDKDINLLIKPRNARIIREMRAQGWASVSALCESAHLQQTTIGQLVNMTISPLHRKTQKWRKAAIDLATCLRVTPGILWPDHMQRIIANKAKAEIEVSLDHAMRLSSPELDPSLLLEHKEIIDSLFDGLTPRVRALIDMRMHGATLEEAGSALNVSRERIRQIEARAHRKMKHKALTKFGANNLSEIWT